MKTKYLFAIISVVLALLVAYPFVAQKKKEFFGKTVSKVENITSRNQDEPTTENATYGHVHALWINPQDHSLLMGTHNGLFKSTDAGKSFSKVEVKGEVKADDFMNFAYDANNKILYAGGHDLGVIKSADGGTTWAKADSGISGMDIHALAINPLDPNRLYAFSVDNGVYGSKDGAKSWYRIDDGPANLSVRAFGYMATPSSMDRGMRTDKTTNIGYLWGGTSGGLYSSFACFCGWTKTTGISDNTTIYTLAPDPVNRSVMFAGTKEGIYKTIDEGKTFTKVIDINSVATISFDETDSKVVFTITSDGVVYRSENRGNSWNRIQ